MSTIPASRLVNVIPGVLAAGGNAVDLNGLFLTTSQRPPIGTVQQFASPDGVSRYFGGTSTEKTLADKYFAGFDGSTAKPGTMLFAQYPVAPVNAYLRGGANTLTLAQLQALTQAISVTIDGVLKTATSNLSSATSFSGAASTIANDLGIHGTQAATITAAISGTLMTVSAVNTGGPLAVGQVISGSGVTAGTYILSFNSGSGNTGTYTVSASQTVGSESMTVFNPGVTYDSISGSFIIWSGTTGASSTITYATGALATSLNLTAALGAVLSQGSIAAVPSTFMNALITVNRDWASFMTAFNPDNSGNANKLLFAAWTNSKADAYAYICWDNDATPATTVPATTSLGYLIAQAGYNGICLIGQDAADASDTNLMNVAAFICGFGASLNFDQLNGRATAAYRTQPGLLATCTDDTSQLNLLSNGYNFYGAYATANTQFVGFQNGEISGAFLWLDSYLNQIWLNSGLQAALLVLQQQALSLPFNSSGYARVEAAMADPINAAVSFGAINTDIPLSASQKASVNTAAGSDVASVLSTRGWAISIQPASPTLRAARGPLPILFWYTDGGSIQTINLSSTAVE